MRLLGNRFGATTLAAVAGLAGLTAGCLGWAAVSITPEPLRPPKPTGGVAAKAVSPSARLGELLVAPPAFSGATRAPMIGTQASGVVTGPATDVRVLGVARVGRSGRALISDSTGKARWIAVGACEDSLCVTAVGRSSAVLTIGGERRLVDIFKQGQRSAQPLAPVVLTAPPAPVQPPAAERPAVPPAPSGMVEPSLPGGEKPIQPQRPPGQP